MKILIIDDSKDIHLLLKAILNSGGYNDLLFANSASDAFKYLGMRHEKSDVCGFVTLSMGIASILPDDKSTPASLISYADKALYDAKQNGRNRITVYEMPKKL